jgi:hypothetical protein
MRRALLATAAAAVLAALPAAPAQGAFGLHGLTTTFAPSLQAGSHPDSFTTELAVNTAPHAGYSFELPDGEAKDVLVELPAGLVGTPTPGPRCSSQDFVTEGPYPESNNCANSTALGTAEVEINEPGEIKLEPVYNLVPPPGAAAKFGFQTIGVPVTVLVRVNPAPPYNVIVASEDILSQVIRFYGIKLTAWGVPSDPAHDGERGHCINSGGISGESCPSGTPEVPFLTLPTRCEGPLTTVFEADSWESPGAWTSASAQTPEETTGCEKLGFTPQITADPTDHAASSPTGLDFGLDVADEGLADPHGYANSQIKKAEVTLPEGMTANPGLAAGLEACGEADLAREGVDTAPGEGCPQASKIGTVEVETPLLQGALLKGSVFLAKPYQNPFGSLLALYMVIREPELGILVKLPGRVSPDPATGQLITTFGEAPYEIPQFPFSHFRFHFREGAGSPLITPPGCGEYKTVAKFTPWADPSQIREVTASFQISSGPGGVPCPPPGPPPFAPGFSAGSASNTAGAYSPFLMRLTRRDGDQDITRFSAKLPPGVSAKLAGVARCPDYAIAVAKSKSGTQERESPSCPGSSRIGAVLAGAGAGSQLTYVPGSLYLAGPYQGAPLSVVAIVPAVAGPFDVGTVVTREALRIDPRSGEVAADGAASDPIPHILAGIPLTVRDIRVSVDRPSFTLNPTSCEPSSVDAWIWGGGADPFSSADDAPVPLAERFQASSCAALGFTPSLRLRLRGGTRRGAFPKLRGEYRPRPGDANLAKLILRLPHSAFLEQGHFGTICTRGQYAAKACPPKSAYGRARAFTPLLDTPLEGPVYLRSSNHNLPDLVASLHGIVDVEAVARIDSKNGGIRATFDSVPDAPLSKVVVNMQGGKKGLIVNSTDLCAARHRANARYFAHNARRAKGHPALRALGCKKAKRRRHGAKR